MEIKNTDRYRITKIDGRHNGWQRFRYFVSVHDRLKTPQAVDMFVSWRVWCWETWGPSKELDFFYYSDEAQYQNNAWCWECGDYTRRIYLQDDPQLSLFMLRWT